jgi:WD40 repeat protein
MTRRHVHHGEMPKPFLHVLGDGIDIWHHNGSEGSKLFLSMFAAMLMILTSCDVQAQQVTAPAMVIPVGGIPCDFRMSRDGVRLAVATFKSKAFVYDLPDAKKVLELDVHGPGARVALSPDGKLVAVSAADNRDVSIIDISTKKVVGRIPNRIGENGQLLFSPTGDALYILQSEPGSKGIVAYTLKNKKVGRLFPKGLVHKESIFSMVIDDVDMAMYYYRHYDSSTSHLQGFYGSINSYSGTRTLVRRDLKTGKEGVIYTDAAGDNTWNEKVRLALSPDRQTVILDQVAIDVISGEVSEDFDNKLHAAEFSRDGRFIACSQGAGASLCDATTGIRLALLSKRASRDVDNKFVPPIFSLDGTKVFTSGDDESIWVWDINEFLKQNPTQ